MPVRVEMTTALMPNLKMTMSDFEFNVDLDESLFSVEPPAGYKVSTVRLPKTNDPAAGEKDLIEAFRHYCELSGGTFPDFLNHEAFTEMLYGGLWLFYSLDHSATSNEERHQKEHYAVDKLFNRGLDFVVFLPKESDCALRRRERRARRGRHAHLLVSPEECEELSSHLRRSVGSRSGNAAKHASRISRAVGKRSDRNVAGIQPMEWRRAAERLGPNHA